MVITVVLLLFFLGIGGFLRDYACNSLGELRYQLVCAKERRKLSEKLNKKERKKADDEVKYLEKKVEKFQRKWKFFLGKNPISSFDALIIEQELQNLH